jgi:glycosyltransferase involved in cell wall biosynthesis
VRILYLTNGFPYPLTSGYLRHYFFIKALAGEHRITLLSVVTKGFEPAHAVEMARYAERVETFAARHRGASRWRKLAHRLTHLNRNREVGLMRAAVRRELAAHHYDALLLSGKSTFAAIDGLAGLPPLVADMCDATSARLDGQLRLAAFPYRWWLRLDRHQTARTEQHIVASARHVIFASRRDRDVIVNSQTHASVLPNGIDTAFWRRTATKLGTGTIVFTGAMNYAPNADAAVVLARDILPLVRKVVPAARLLIVGHSPGPDVVALQNSAGVTVTGFVDDVRPFLEQATVFAAPLRFGAGIQNKLLEALAMSVPVVATPLAADGLETANGIRPPLEIADTNEQFASVLARQLVERAIDRRPAIEGRVFVEQHFTWETSGRALDVILNGLRASEAA